MTATTPVFFFWLVKTTPTWLAMPPLGAGGRVEFVRETQFWDYYFQILHFIPTMEDGYADHYEQTKVGG